MRVFSMTTKPAKPAAAREVHIQMRDFAKLDKNTLSTSCFQSETLAAVHRSLDH